MLLRAALLLAVAATRAVRACPTGQCSRGDTCCFFACGSCDNCEACNAGKYCDSAWAADDERAKCAVAEVPCPAGKSSAAGASACAPARSEESISGGPVPTASEVHSVQITHRPCAAGLSTTHGPALGPSGSAAAVTLARQHSPAAASSSAGSSAGSSSGAMGSVTAEMRSSQSPRYIYVEVPIKYTIRRICADSKKC